MMTPLCICVLNDDITLNLTSSIKKPLPILPYFHHIDTSKSLLQLLVSSVGELFHEKSAQPYIIMSQALAKAVPNSILRHAEPLSYKALQHISMEDDGAETLGDPYQKQVPLPIIRDYRARKANT